mmetsp:Transcript_18082/g.30399  ORF Transcript_18082/g.30399 Transcript_18082/m.30399 type:complete len:395 (+) Transcript_18082:184-1368(+)
MPFPHDSQMAFCMKSYAYSQASSTSLSSMSQRSRLPGKTAVINTQLYSSFQVAELKRFPNSRFERRCDIVCKRRNNARAKSEFRITKPQRAVTTLCEEPFAHTLSVSTLRNNERMQVTYTNDGSVIGDWLDRHVPNTCGSNVLGFDTETRPSFQKGQGANATSTLQLSTPDSCLVAHLTHFEKSSGPRSNSTWQPALLEVLANPSVLKVGVGLDQDAIELWKSWGVECYGRFELTGVGAPSQGKGLSLSRLAEAILDIALPKSKTITMSNWDNAPLDIAQVEYAALDAWVGRMIYDELVEHRPSLFGQEAVRFLVERERTLEDLVLRQHKRKEARLALRECLEETKTIDRKLDSARLEVVVSDLTKHKRTIEELRPDGTFWWCIDLDKERKQWV